MSDSSLDYQSFFPIPQSLLGTNFIFEAEPEDESVESHRMADAMVVSVRSDRLIVREYDFGQGAIVENTYEVPARTEFENIRSLADLKSDDSVIIHYVKTQGRRIAEVIVGERL